MRRIRNIELLKEDLRQHVDIVQFFKRYIPDLVQRGQRWIGLCPFHNDANNPGFAVSPDVVYEKDETKTGSRGVWACWTCDARGDLFKFVERMHDASFIEAIELIAEITDFDLTPYYRDLTPEERLKEQRYEVVSQIAALFTEELLSRPKRLNFFSERGIEADTLRTFAVGFCPSIDFLTKNIDREILDFIEPESYNRLRLFGGRIVYAQFTTDGKIWGWYARQPDDRAPEVPKYIGTSKNAALFDGNERLYGFFHARKLLRQAERPITIVEGFHDTLAAHQAGFATIAACGTRLSDNQIQTLQGHAIRKAIVCFDPDDGGRSGMMDLAQRAHKIQGVQFKFVEMASEPEEFILHFGAEAYGDALDDALGAIDFIVERNSEMDTSTPTKKRDFLDHIRPYLMPYPRRSLDRALGVQAVSRKTGLSEDVVADYLDERSDSPLSNLPAEMIVLAELAMNPQSWVTLAGVSRRDFSLKRYSQTYDLMCELYEREASVNIELLLTHAANSRAPQEIMETISKLASTQRRTPELFARDIRDKAIRRQAAELASVMQAQVNDLKSPVNETLANSIELITQSISTTVRRQVYSQVEAINELEAEMIQRSHIETGIAGLDAGPDWSELMKKINGFRGGRTMLVCATSGVGKSIVLANWIWNLSVREFYGVQKIDDQEYQIEAPRAAGLIVSMEMTKAENMARIVSMDSGVPHLFVDHARYDSQEQCDLVLAAMDRAKGARLTWMEGPQSIREIAMQARLLQARGELDYIVLDYVQLADLTTYSDRWSNTEKYNALSGDIITLAHSLNVPIMSAAQLNRGAYEQDIPTGENMGSAYKIYQDAHACYILAPRENGLVGSLDKNRGGGKGIYKLSFDSNEDTSNLRMREIDSMKRLSSR